MRFIDNRGITDPRLNLALEEHVLREHRDDESYLLFYVNEPSIIIGRNQNTLEEVNAEYVRERGIHVVRRISGGGAVYHDHGNLNFSFITPYTPERFNRYDEFTRPVIAALHALGVPAELTGRNDIVAAGRKISGNAQFTSQGRMFSHGTLLFDSDLDAVTAALNVKPGKIESKGVKSVRARVANIAEFLDEPVSLAAFRERILALAFDGGEASRLELTDEDWRQVHALADRKYGTWEWNYGQSPTFNLQRTRRFPAGEIDLRLQVESGHIAELKIFGDFMGRSEVAGLEAQLRGLRYDRGVLREALGAVPIADYFGDVPEPELLELFVD